MNEEYFQPGPKFKIISLIDVSDSPTVLAHLERILGVNAEIVENEAQRHILYGRNVLYMGIVDVVPDPEVLQPGIRSIIRIAANCIAPNFTNHLIFFPEADQTLYWFVKR